MARRKNRIPVESVLHGNLLLLVLVREYTPNSRPDSLLFRARPFGVSALLFAFIAPDRHALL